MDFFFACLFQILESFPSRQPASGKLSCGQVVSLTNDDHQDIDQHEEMSPDSFDKTNY